MTFAGEKHADPADSDPVGGTLNHSAFTTKKRRGDSLSLPLPNMRARDGASISFQTPSSARRLLVPGVSVRKLDPLADDVPEVVAYATTSFHFTRAFLKKS